MRNGCGDVDVTWNNASECDSNDSGFDGGITGGNFASGYVSRERCPGLPMSDPMRPQYATSVAGPTCGTAAARSSEAARVIAGRLLPKLAVPPTKNPTVDV